MRAFTGCRILPVCRSAGLNVIAAGILAMSCGSAPAQQDFPEGAWAIGNRNSCSTRPYELHIAQDVWQFTDARHAVNVEKVLSASGRKYLTETISSPDVPRGTRWTYTFTGDAVGLVSNSLGTSFTIFRCTDLPADARASPPLSRGRSYPTMVASRLKGGCSSARYRPGASRPRQTPTRSVKSGAPTIRSS